MLRRIQKPVAVLGICGPYRSGKSYFGSRFMRSDDFSVSHGFDPCTKGIWMSTSILESEEFAILFLDTEGIGAAQASEASSNEEVMKYLIITALLCSYLIYNTKGAITQEHLYQMRYIYIYKINANLLMVTPTSCYMVLLVHNTIYKVCYFGQG